MLLATIDLITFSLHVCIHCPCTPLVADTPFVVVGVLRSALSSLLGDVGGQGGVGVILCVLLLRLLLRGGGC